MQPNLEHGHLRHIGGVDIPPKRQHPYRFWIAVLFAACCIAVVAWSVARADPTPRIPPVPELVIPEHMIPLPGKPRVLPGKLQAHIFAMWAESLNANCKADGGDLYYSVDPAEAGWITYWCQIPAPPQA